MSSIVQSPCDDTGSKAICVAMECLNKMKAKSIDNGMIQAIYSTPEYVIFRTSAKNAGPVKLQTWFALKPSATTPVELLLAASEKKWKVACMPYEFTSDTTPTVVSSVYITGISSG